MKNMPKCYRNDCDEIATHYIHWARYSSGLKSAEPICRKHAMLYQAECPGVGTITTHSR